MFIFIWLVLMVAMLWNFSRSLNKARRYTKKIFVPMKAWENEMATEDLANATTGSTYSGGSTNTARKYIYSDEQMKIIKGMSYNDHSLTLIQWVRKLVKTCFKVFIGVIGFVVLSQFIYALLGYVMYITKY